MGITERINSLINNLVPRASGRKKKWHNKVQEEWGCVEKENDDGEGIGTEREKLRESNQWSGVEWSEIERRAWRQGEHAWSGERGGKL